MRNERLQHEHDWDIELECPNCHHKGVPRFEKTPNTTVNVINAGSRPHVFANLNCPECDSDLKTEAEEKLRELFANTAIPLRNRLWMSVIVLPGSAGILSLAGMWFEPLSWLTPALTPLSIIILLSIPAYKYLVRSISRSCVCGNPQYSFLGLLGRSYCYRCSSCGRLLRLLF